MNLAMMFRHNDPPRFGLGGLGYRPIDFRGMIGGSGFRMRGGSGRGDTGTSSNKSETSSDKSETSSDEEEDNDDYTSSDDEDEIKTDEDKKELEDLGIVFQGISIPEEIIQQLNYNLYYGSIKTKSEYHYWLDEALKIGFDAFHTKKKFMKSLTDRFGDFEMNPENWLKNLEIFDEDDNQEELEESLMNLGKREIIFKEIPDAILPDPRGITANKDYELETAKNWDKIYSEDGERIFGSEIFPDEQNPIYYKNGKPIMTIFAKTGEKKFIGELTPWDLVQLPSKNKTGGLIDNKNYYNESIDDIMGVRVQKSKITGDGSPFKPLWININEYSRKESQWILYNTKIDTSDLKTNNVYKGNGYSLSLIARMREGDYFANMGETIKNAFTPQPYEMQTGYNKYAPQTVNFNGKEYPIYYMTYNPKSGYDTYTTIKKPILPENATTKQRREYDTQLDLYNDKKNYKVDRDYIYVPKNHFERIIKK